MNNNIKGIFLGVFIGSVITLSGFLLLSPTKNMNDEVNIAEEKQPLYWVAPMDANYQRDKPGKSPMGMDLVPVYSDNNQGEGEGVGTIRISADVVNNLGVRTVTASYQAMHNQINTVGYVTYNEDKLVHIHPRVEGWIEKLYVKSIGDPVTKGQALYDIYSPELVNAQEELLLALDRQNNRLIQAAENRLMALQLPLLAINQLKKVKKVQQQITFYAPQNGVVENLNIREGFYVKPGSTLLSIGDLSEVWVDAEIFESQAGQVKQGTAVTMTLDYLPGKEWLGQVDYIYPILDAKTRTLKVRVRFENDNGEFKPNMFAQIVIHANSEAEVLLIPKEALIRTGNQNRVVLALGNGRFKSVEVSIGRVDSQSVEILSGLADGETVVSSAQFLLDSESSKTSDFKRMDTRSHTDNSQGGVMHDDANEQINESSESELDTSTAWVKAQVMSLMADHKMLTLTHEPIPDWDWPEMTMNFTVAESIDFSLFTVGLSLHVEIEKMASGKYQVINIHIPETEAPVPQAMGDADDKTNEDHGNDHEHH